MKQKLNSESALQLNLDQVAHNRWLESLTAEKISELARKTSELMRSKSHTVASDGDATQTSSAIGEKQ